MLPYSAITNVLSGVSVIALLNLKKLIGEPRSNVFLNEIPLSELLQTDPFTHTKIVFWLEINIDFMSSWNLLIKMMDFPPSMLLYRSQSSGYKHPKISCLLLI